MTNPNSRSGPRQSNTRQQVLQRKQEQHQIKTYPAHFRAKVQIPSPTGELLPLPQLLTDWQQRDFAALDHAWRKLAGQPIEVPYQRAYIERPRGHSKTSDMALQLAWGLLYGRKRLNGIAAAADRDQARLIHEAIQRLADWNPDLFAGLTILKDAIINRKTHSRVRVISSDVGSSWGVLPDFIICDEVCHWEQGEFWHSLFSSAAKKADCLLAVLTNAGRGRDWQWDLREMARNSPEWYFSSLDGPHAPWIAPQWLAEQKQMLPPPVYNRLWLNQWQHSDGEFVTLEEAEACRDETLSEQAHGQPGFDYIAAIDYAEKHDLTVGVILHREGTRLIVDRMDVKRPMPHDPTRIEWVDEWIEQTVAQFHRVTFILDEYQLVGTIQKYEPSYDVRRFNFAAGLGNHALAIALRRVILEQQVAWYPGCGQLANSDQRNDLETEMAALLLKVNLTNRCRIDHPTGANHFDDRSFVLGAAVLHLLETDGEGEWMTIV